MGGIIMGGLLGGIGLGVAGYAVGTAFDTNAEWGQEPSTGTQQFWATGGAVTGALTFATIGGAIGLVADGMSLFNPATWFSEGPTEDGGLRMVNATTSAQQATAALRPAAKQAF